MVNEELGHVQHFSGVGGEPAVICARQGKKAVAVAEVVWHDILGVVGHPVRGLRAVGFPLVDRDYVPADAARVELSGGEWGNGVLTRPPARWAPQPRVLMEASCTRQSPPAETTDLTVRAVAILPWDLDEAVREITRPVRRQLEAMLPQTALSAMFPLLSRRRGGMVTRPQWIRPTGHGAYQSGTIARYDSVLEGPDGRTAARSSVRLFLPAARERIVRVFAEYQVNFEPWQAALTGGPSPADLRITAHEIVELWQAAWEAATIVVPGALVGDPATMPLMAPPVVEFQLKADDPTEYKPAELQRLTILPKMIDLSAFGTTADNLFREGALSVVAPIDIAPDDRHRLTRTALTRLARAWGYIDADESDLGYTDAVHRTLRPVKPGTDDGIAEHVEL